MNYKFILNIFFNILFTLYQICLFWLLLKMWGALFLLIAIATAAPMEAIASILVKNKSSDSYEGPWRDSLDNPGSCWSSPTSQCNRVLTTSHGGDWGADYPYDSFPAFERAYFNGADAVKGDFRVSLDNIGMVMHSSPVEVYESLNCFGKYVEKMTAAECQKCKMAYGNTTFISVPTFLDWAAGKVNVMLCVKQQAIDLPRAISTLIENNAQHRAYLEIHLDTLLNLQDTAPAGWDQVYYVVELGNTNDVHKLLATAGPALLSRTILFEFNDWESWGSTLQDDIRLVQANDRRTMAATKDSGVMATVDNHLKLFSEGFDVAYTYNLLNAVEARMQVNTERGLTPP